MEYLGFSLLFHKGACTSSLYGKPSGGEDENPFPPCSANVSRVGFSSRQAEQRESSTAAAAQPQKSLGYNEELSLGLVPLVLDVVHGKTSQKKF